MSILHLDKLSSIDFNVTKIKQLREKVEQKTQSHHSRSYTYKLYDFHLQTVGKGKEKVYTMILKSLHNDPIH